MCSYVQRKSCQLGFCIDAINKDFNHTKSCSSRTGSSSILSSTSWVTVSSGIELQVVFNWLFHLFIFAVIPSVFGFRSASFFVDYSMPLYMLFWCCWCPIPAGYCLTVWANICLHNDMQYVGLWATFSACRFYWLGPHLYLINVMLSIDDWH